MAQLNPEPLLLLLQREVHLACVPPLPTPKRSRVVDTSRGSCEVLLVRRGSGRYPLPLTRLIRQAARHEPPALVSARIGRILDEIRYSSSSEARDPNHCERSGATGSNPVSQVAREVQAKAARGREGQGAQTGGAMNGDRTRSGLRPSPELLAILGIGATLIGQQACQSSRIDETNERITRMESRLSEEIQSSRGSTEKLMDAKFDAIGSKLELLIHSHRLSGDK